MSKAFDCVNHDILLRKPKELGFYGLKIKLLQSYLTNQKQGTVIKTESGGKNSLWANNKYGVSILGPLLFLTHINDLPSHFSRKICDVILYDDDKTAFLKRNTILTLHKDAKLTIEVIAHWFLNNFLLLNEEKTNILYFNLRNSSRSSEYRESTAVATE